MCYDEKTSWLTLGIGSIVNIGVLLYLGIEHHKSQNKDLIYPVVVLLIFQFALFMQIPEGIAWGQLRRNKKIEKGLGLAVSILLIMQPVILSLLMYGACVYTGRPIPIRFWVTVLIILLWLLNFHYGLCFWKGGTKLNGPTPQCNHLQIQWAASDPKILILYLLLMLFFFSILPPTWWVTATVIFLGSYMWAAYMYPCATGSMWCWSIAFSGLVVLLVDTFQRKVF
tara:strand:+ start:135 stop:812 length:678 start_codon:yes stop_codon:yes gene_type:complete